MKIIVIAVIWYLIGAFAQATLDIREWSEMTRALIAYAAICTYVAPVFLAYLNGTPENTFQAVDKRSRERAGKASRGRNEYPFH